MLSKQGSEILLRSCSHCLGSVICIWLCSVSSLWFHVLRRLTTYFTLLGSLHGNKFWSNWKLVNNMSRELSSSIAPQLYLLDKVYQRFLFLFHWNSHFASISLVIHRQSWVVHWMALLNVSCSLSMILDCMVCSGLGLLRISPRLPLQSLCTYVLISSRLWLLTLSFSLFEYMETCLLRIGVNWWKGDYMLFTCESALARCNWLLPVVLVGIIDIWQ